MKFVLTILFCLTVVGCVSMPDAASSRLFTVMGAGFTLSFDHKPPSQKYMLALNLRERLQTPLFLDIYYQNPLDPNDYLIERQRIEVGATEVILESDDVDGMKRNQVYNIRVVAYQDEQRTEKVDELMQPILYALDPKALR